MASRARTASKEATASKVDTDNMRSKEDMASKGDTVSSKVVMASRADGAVRLHLVVGDSHQRTTRHKAADGVRSGSAGSSLGVRS